jgi:hypothetical protein
MTTKPQLPLPERLKKGAAILGQLWKVPENRCPAGWSLYECECQPQRKFCVARLHWIVLAIEDGRPLEEGPYGMFLAMRASEWDATGLSPKIQHPELNVITVGSGPGCVTKMSEMGKIMDTPEVLENTLLVLKHFPNASIQGVVEPSIAVEPKEMVEEVPE